MLVKNDFLSHWKVKLLCKRLGDGPALRALISLWAYCEQRRAWEFRLSALELAGVCDYGGNPDELFQLLRDLRLIMPAEDGYIQVNGWGELNSALVHKWPGRRLSDQEYWHPRGMISNGAIPKAKAQPIAPPIPNTKGKAKPQAIGLDRIGLESTPIPPEGAESDLDPTSRAPKSSPDLFAQPDTVTEPKAQSAKKKKGAASRTSGSIELPEGWSDARRAAVSDWMAARLLRGFHFTPDMLRELMESTAALSDAQLRSCVDDAMRKRLDVLQPHRFIGRQLDMFDDSTWVEEIYKAYPRKVSKPAALRAIAKAMRVVPISGRDLQARTEAYAIAVAAWPQEDRQFIPHPATWYNNHRFNDDPVEWQRIQPETARKKEGPPQVSDVREKQVKTLEEPDQKWMDVWDLVCFEPCPRSWSEVPAEMQRQLIVYLQSQLPEPSRSRWVYVWEEAASGVCPECWHRVPLDQQRQLVDYLAERDRKEGDETDEG